MRNNAILSFLHHLVAAGLLAVLTACARQEISPFRSEYRMQVNVGPNTAWGMGAARFAELAREKTSGRINIKPYYRSQLLKGAQLKAAQMVAEGAIDLALESTINISPVIPQMNVFSLPFFVRTYERLERLENGRTGQILFRLMRHRGLEPLGWGENGFRQLTTRRGPVRRPADLRGMRIRVVGSPIFIETFRALGADPVNMNWGDAVTAFQQGVVDGQENPVEILIPVQIYQYHRYALFWNYACDPLVLYWNRREWETFPAEIRTALREAAEEALAFQKALSRVGLDGGASIALLENRFHYRPPIRDPRAYLQQHGMIITDLSPTDRQAFQAATEKVRQRWREIIGAAIYQAACHDLGENDE